MTSARGKRKLRKHAILREARDDHHACSANLLILCWGGVISQDSALEHRFGNIQLSYLVVKHKDGSVSWR